MGTVPIRDATRALQADEKELAVLLFLVFQSCLLIQLLAYSTLE
jgi:hypothetical protein